MIDMMYGNDDVGDDDEEEDVDDNLTWSSATLPLVWDFLFLWIKHFWLATS